MDQILAREASEAARLATEMRRDLESRPCEAAEDVVFTVEVLFARLPTAEEAMRRLSDAFGQGITSTPERP